MLAIGLAVLMKGGHSRAMALDRDIDWKVSDGFTDYQLALETMEDRALAIRDSGARELIWLVEHPPLFTAGTSADAAELFNPQGFPVFDAGRGGRYTYHGPGQRVVYLMLDLERRGKDIRRFVHALEGWMIGALADVGISARREPGRIGIWTGRGADEAKIGAIGIRVRRWVTMHGCAINVSPDLSHFGGIVPCGIADFGVTSLAKCGVDGGIGALDLALSGQFPRFLNALCSEQQVA